MADDASALTSKILLRHAENKSKAKSWLVASLGSEPEDQNTNDVNPASSLPVKPDHDLTSLIYGDENSGIGSAKKDNESELSLNRQLLSANNALQWRLLSRDAYKKYNSSSQSQGRTKIEAGGSADSTRHTGMGKRRALHDEDEDEEEIKGRSSLGRIQKSQQQQKSVAAVIEEDHDSALHDAIAIPTTSAVDSTAPAVSVQDMKAASTSPKKRARPGTSYLDQVLSKRQQKKRKGK